MPGRGVHDGVKRMKLWLEDKENTRYCLKLDIKKYYPSINHNILKSLIRKKVKCADTLWLLDEIIDSTPGIPIGNYLSQYFGNLYLAYFDHWMKETQGCRYYARYCDDIVVLHKSKVALHSLFDDVKKYLGDTLRLTIKENWQVFPTHVRGIDFLGYRFFGTHTLVRKRIVKKFLRQIGLAERCGLNARSANSIMSYYGWLKHGDAHHLWSSALVRLKDAGHGHDIPQPLRRGL